MQKDVCPGGVFHNQKDLDATGLCPYHLPLKSLPAIGEVPGNLVQVGLALYYNLVLESGVTQHDGVISSLQGPALVLNVMLVQPGNDVLMNLLPAVSYDHQFFQLLFDLRIGVVGQHPTTSVPRKILVIVNFFELHQLLTLRHGAFPGGKFRRSILVKKILNFEVSLVILFQFGCANSANPSRKGKISVINVEGIKELGHVLIKPFVLDDVVLDGDIASVWPDDDDQHGIPLFTLRIFYANDLHPVVTRLQPLTLFSFIIIPVSHVSFPPRIICSVCR
nr:MAG TPA: hypothetical protein [Caudoviricetes sp.]